MLGLQLGLGFNRGGSTALPWYTLGKADDTDPSFWADFANNRYAVNGAEEAFTDIFTFTRSTTGTYFDAGGVMQTAALNTPRFDHNPATGEALGLLVEGQRTNLITYSEDLSMWVGTSSTTLSSNVAEAPTGAITADKISDADTATTFRRVANPNPISVTSGVTYTVSCFVKAAGHDYFYIRTDVVAGSLQNIAVNLTDGSITRTPAGWTVSATDCGNGWYRIEASAQVTTTNAARAIYLSISDSPVTTDNISSYAGTVGSGVYVWGVQFEQGAFATSYIPTTTTSVTRSADYVANTGSNTVPFSSWFNASEGTFLIDWHCDHIFQAGGRLLYAAYKASDQWNYRLFGEGAGAGPSLKHNSVSGGSFTASIGSAALSGNDFTDAFAYKTDDFSVYRDGVSLGIDASGAVPSGLDSLTIGGIATSNQFFGHIREFRYYPKRISNSELQRITS